MLHLTDLFLRSFSKGDLLLNESCDPNIRERFSKKNKQISNYPLHVKNIDEIYENLLDLFFEYLKNEFKFKITKQGIRILYGSWLYSFVIAIYDRYLILKNFDKENSLSNQIIPYIPMEKFNINFLSSYSAVFALIRSSNINQYIFQTLIDYLYHDRINKKQIEINKLINVTDSEFPNANFKKSYLRVFIFNLQKYIRKFIFSLSLNKCVFCFSYLSLSDMFRICLNFNSVYIPSEINDLNPFDFQNEKDFKIRKKLENFLINNLSKNLSEKNTFIVKPLIKILVELTPRCLLENLNDLSYVSSSLFLPVQNTKIFTANSYYLNDVFCMYVANNKVLTNSKFFIIQHGGNYGNAKFNSSEKHQRLSSDYYLTWGWVEDNKTIDIGICKKLKAVKKVRKTNIEILFITMELERYTYMLMSAPQGSDWIDYQKFLEATFKGLREEKFDIVLRPKPKSNCWNSLKRWQTITTKIDLKTNFFNLCSKSKLVISTYNAATYLETMSMNIPTIIYWDPNQWELRDSAKNIFGELKSMNVLIHDYEHLLETLNYAKKIGYENWWNYPARKAVVEKFCNEYAKLPKSYHKMFVKKFIYNGL